MKLTYTRSECGYYAMQNDVEITHIDNREYLKSGYWGKFHFCLKGIPYDFGTLRDAKAKLEKLLTTQDQ